MSVEETLEEVGSIHKKKEVIPPGPPWSIIATFNTFEEANSARAKIKTGFVKIRRRTNGTFTVHTRETPPGGVNSKKK